MRSALRRAHTIAWLLGFLAAGTARPAAADTLTLMWDRSPDTSVVGYLVYVGTQSGSYGGTYDVGNVTSFSYSAVPGQQYYFAVAAYSPGPIIGPRSVEVYGGTSGAPVLQNPGNQTSTVGASATLQLVGSDPAGQPVSYGATSLPPGLSISPATGVINGTPTTPGSYLVRATVSDGSLSDAETFTWTVNQPLDTSAPDLTITVPTTAGNYSTPQTFLTLGGTASDNGEVTDVTWATDRGNSGRATGTDSWLAGIPLQRGPNTITVRARDAAGNVSSRAIVVKSTGGKAK